jgi:hypothetical protein
MTGAPAQSTGSRGACNRRSQAHRHGVRPSFVQAAVIPYPAETDAHFHRLGHADLAILTADALWSESIVLTTALADRLFGRQRDELLIINNRPFRESGWLRQRLQLIAQELRRRRL